MANVQEQIEARIKVFVAELNNLVRAAAMDAVRGALGGGGGSSAAPRRRGRPPGSKNRTAPAAAKPSAPAQKRGKRSGGKRSPAAMQKAIQGVRDYVASHPGRRVEQIGPALHLATKELARPIAKLLASGHLRREGQKRATKYFPGPRATTPVPAAGTPGRPKATKRRKKK